ncbi:DUF4062 domain-containing protein [Rodentibacter caecimuris]|uniref:DUF4062 domain-containing protein n=1 Tax=Rodentibacter caecimuris TaxID=1796644 RepID=UPI002119E21A|nr:DUF4062 domain-containing protein [Rodentibacter heylii]
MLKILSAEDSQQWEIIKRTIDSSDYYVVIIGHRYGSIEPKDGISYTEKEYDYAVSKDIPVLAFIQDRNVALKPHERENDKDKADKLDKFVDKAKTRMCQFWTDSNDLISKVPTALFKSFLNKPQIGWIRGSNSISPEVVNELARLSKENNELKNKLLELERDNDIPNINIQLNGGDSLELSYPDRFEGTISVPKMLKRESIEPDLLEFITDGDIEQYNSNIPSEEEIYNYNKAQIRNELISKNKFPLFFSISNMGQVKATDIHIELSFPKEIKLFFKGEEPSLEFIKDPRPSDILLSAEKKKREATDPVTKLINQYSNLGRVVASPSILPPLKLENLNRSYRKDLYLKDNNVVVIKVDSLLQTLTTKIDRDLFIVPLEKGNYVVVAYIICEQYKDGVELSFPLIIK